MDQLTQVITYLAITSVAAERFVDMVKRLGLEKLTTNGVVYQILSGLFGAALAYYSPPEFSALKLNGVALAIVTGLAVSSGSSVWNNMLTALTEYRKSLKAIK